MKFGLYIFLLFFLTGCKSESENKILKNSVVDSLDSKIELNIDNQCIIITDTIKINNKQFIKNENNDRFYCLLSIDGDTIVKAQNFYHSIEILDINEDGYQDIRISIISNTPNQCDNYLFNNQVKKFIQIENCGLDIQKITGTDFYYSYLHAGCSDQNWKSYLYKIKNYKLIEYGYIFGQGCDFNIEDNPQIIEIYKINSYNSNEEILIKKLPYKKYINKYNDKFTFIKKYWSENCKTYNQFYE